MSIGSTIKNLRHEHDMTQEQLAEMLSLTSAAISGWECDRNSPDISQIPLLCRIFGVSADVLLGIDLSVQEEKIDKIIFEASKCGKKESVNVYRLGLAEFPSSHQLMSNLADALNYDGEPETFNDRLKERIALYERVREGTKNAYLKNCAEGHLCRIYLHQGKREEALKIAESVPNLMFSKDDFDLMLAQGKEKIYNLHYNIQKSFGYLCDSIYYITTLVVDEKPFFTHEQAITMLEKIPKMYEIYYENHDYLSKADTVSLAYTHMANHFAALKDADNTIRCIKSALENAKKADSAYEGLENGAYGITDAWDIPQMPKDKRHTSILANPDYDYPTTTVWIAKDAESQVQRCIRDLSHAGFNFIRDEIERITKQYV